MRDKVRIIALYIMHRDGVPDEDRKRLYQHARLGPPEMDAINNLPKLGQEVTKVGQYLCAETLLKPQAGYEAEDKICLQADFHR